MGNFRVPIQELVEFNREQEWERSGVAEEDVRFSRFCGMDARDVAVFRRCSSRRYLIVVRCPKLTARPWHGVLPPKPLATKDKTGSSGVVVTAAKRIFVSDYDLMSVWKGAPGEYRKIFISASGGAARGHWSMEAQALVLEMNASLVSRIQHGCQDDYHSPKNPGVAAKDHFAAFHDGISTYLPTAAECARFYERMGLAWPYSPAGKYVGEGATG